MNLRELLCNHDRSNIENWIRARARTAYVGDSVLCRVLGSLNLYVDPANYDMSPWLMLDGLWEMWIAMAIGRAIQPGWTCVDAGAWCGFYTVMMSELVGPAGRVLAFEPNKTHRDLAQRSVRANGQEQWSDCYGYALSDKAGRMGFITTDGGGSRLKADGGNTEVETVTLDQMAIAKEKVNLIKMDIEGGEEQAWYGMQCIIDRNPQIIIVMEWEPGRYVDATGFLASIQKRFPVIRDITTDGVTTVIDPGEMLKPVMRNVWLQV